MTAGGRIQTVDGKLFAQGGLIVAADECCCDGEGETVPVYLLTPCFAYNSVNSEGTRFPCHLRVVFSGILPCGCLLRGGGKQSQSWALFPAVNREWHLDAVDLYAYCGPDFGSATHWRTTTCSGSSYTAYIDTVAIGVDFVWDPDADYGQARVNLYQGYGSASTASYFQGDTRVDGYDGFSPIRVFNTNSSSTWGGYGGYADFYPGDLRYGPAPSCPGGDTICVTGELDEHVGKVIKIDGIWYEVSSGAGCTPVFEILPGYIEGTGESCEVECEGDTASGCVETWRVL